MTKSETLNRFRRLPTRMSACVVASEGELARLKSQLPDQFQQVFTSIAAPANAPLPTFSLAQTSVLVIEINPALPGSIRRIEQAFAKFPDLPIIAAVENLDLTKVRTLMRLGIKEVVSLPFSADELLPAVIDLSMQPADMSAELAPMQAVLHSSGGIGASTIVSHLAAAITRKNDDARCCIVDLDFQFGEQASLFGASPSIGVVDCLDAGDRLDLEIISTAVTKVRPRIDLLAAPRDIPPTETIDTDQLLNLLGMLRCHYDHVLLDFPSGWSNAGLSAACSCSQLMLVVEHSVKSISRASKTIALLDSVEFAPGSVSLVVNRAEKRLFQAINAQDVGDTLRREIAGIIPLAKSGLQEAQGRGVLLSEQEPRSPFIKAFDQLADYMTISGGGQP